jgi:8-oxo-dGTP diphosphatase
VPDFHCVAFVILRDDRQRLLLARRSGVSYGDGHWGLPGGHVEVGEALVSAASRETLEEVGVRIAVEDLAPIGVIRYADEDMSGLDVYFMATRFAGDPQPLSECDAVGWFDRDALPDDVLPWLPDALARLLDEGAWFTDLVGATSADS